MIKINSDLIKEGYELLKTEFSGEFHTYVDLQKLHKWWGKVKSFGHQLGQAAQPWKENLSTDPAVNQTIFVYRVLGTIEAIEYELKNDLLITVTGLVKAETLADLLDQAEHLFENGYFLAAGVLGRAVLEEHLRTTCENLECTHSKQRPTLNDFNQELYKADHYSKTMMKQIDMLATIGNDAAHNKPGLDSKDVKKLLTDLPSVIESTRV